MEPTTKIPAPGVLVGPLVIDTLTAVENSLTINTNTYLDDKHIATIDESGVALAAIQGLNRKLIDKEAELESLQQQNADLEQRLDRLEKALASRQGQN